MPSRKSLPRAEMFSVARRPKFDLRGNWPRRELLISALNTGAVFTVTDAERMIDLVLEEHDHHMAERIRLGEFLPQDLAESTRRLYLIAHRMVARGIDPEPPS